MDRQCDALSPCCFRAASGQHSHIANSRAVSRLVMAALCLAVALRAASPAADESTLTPLGHEELPACTMRTSDMHTSALRLARTADPRMEGAAAIPVSFTPSFLAPAGYLPVHPIADSAPPEAPEGTDWSAVLHQSARFLFLQHAVRIGTQQKTRRELRGPFFRDYVNSVRGISGWDDGDSFLTNYVGHPMQGSISGYFQVHSHPRERMLEFSNSSAYWKSRLKAMAFNAAYSTHYELGPFGEAAIGNVGLRPGTKGAVDLVITPTLGFAWMVGEDAIDKKIIAPLERRLRNPGSRRLLRTALNPTRTFANFLRGAAPWHRDTRGDVK